MLSDFIDPGPRKSVGKNYTFEKIGRQIGNAQSNRFYFSMLFNHNTLDKYFLSLTSTVQDIGTMVALYSGEQVSKLRIQPCT